MTIGTWLEYASRQLANAGIDSAALDAELILSHTISKNRTHLHAHPEHTLDRRLHDIANARLDMRTERIPLAYIIGHWEFYGRRFRVTPDTLIPRPESEAIIELALKHTPKNTPLRLVDVGTGSGCLGITLRLENPDFDTTLCDISPGALRVAANNAKVYGANVECMTSDLLGAYLGTSDCIIANLPYVDRTWRRSLELDHEPELALFADDGGLALVYELIEQSERRLRSHGYLILETDPRQHKNVSARASQYRLRLIDTLGYAQIFQLS